MKERKKEEKKLNEVRKLDLNTESIKNKSY